MGGEAENMHARKCVCVCISVLCVCVWGVYVGVCVCTCACAFDYVCVNVIVMHVFFYHPIVRVCNIHINLENEVYMYIK
jgi:hypothetical protein